MTSPASSDSPALLLEGVVVVRRGVEALRVDRLEVRRGEFHGIIGPNGSGKSTLLGVICGQLRAAAGEVSLLGRLANGRERRSLRRRLGLVTQLSTVDPRLPISVLESVMVGAYGRLGLWRRPGKKTRQLAMDMLQLTGIAHLASRPLGHCSGGELQRASIARALTQEPEALLLDEPTSALDWRAQRTILSCIRDIHRAMGLTTVMVTHELNALPELCDRVTALREGRVFWTGPAPEALDKRRLQALYDIPFTIAAHGDRSVVLF